MEFWEGLPVIPCKQEEGILVFLISCPYCGRKHIHGAGKPPFRRPPWVAGHRVAHCPPMGEIKRVGEIKQGRKYVKVPLEAARGYFLKVVR
jgi:hypothetical protein